jgi:polygalacturonase
MNKRISLYVSGLVLCSLLAGCTNSSKTADALATVGARPAVYNVRTFGAKGDGTTIDSPAINKAIEAANADGGGTVLFPPGTYLCFSIHLKSNVCLSLDQAATILAADNPLEADAPGYDAPEPNQWDPYEDFGHSHWHNSLIWGENLENISIVGLGRIDGKGLTSGGNPRNRRGAATRRSATQITEADFPANPVLPATLPATRGKFGYPGRDTLPAGIGNKSIALKLCRNVVFKDFTIYRGGHFGILATGVDNWTLSNIKIDTNRDGVDIDCCRNVRMSDCSVNSPNDDGICPKSTYALGENRPCENITITNCQVSGWQLGSFLDGTYKERVDREGRPGGPGTGRIKFGTESNGGFKNITISNCVFDTCRGFALETVDGALLEDIAISNITMRNIGNSPIFMRLGARLRGPDGTEVGALRRIKISNIVCWMANERTSSIISGIPGHDIEDVTISNVRVYAKGGGTKEQATSQPAEKENAYPEPTMFGTMPAYGFFIRHVKGIELRDVEVSYIKDDARPAFVLEDVKGVEFNHVKAQHADDSPVFVLKNVRDFGTFHCPQFQDLKKEKVESDKF